MADLSHPDIVMPDSAETVVRTFEGAGYDCYAVGGCVRDWLMGRTPQDWDFTTNADVPSMKSLLDAHGLRWSPTGEAHGTLTVIVDGDAYEVTTYRIDGDYSEGRHPDSVTFAQTIEEDLARRDFTVNAMAWSRKTGLVDCYGGLRDLDQHIIRTVGNPYSRFSEDGLRIMRALRFAATLDFHMDGGTTKAIHDCHALLGPISKERLYAELSKLMVAEDPRHLARVMFEFSDVLFMLMPELCQLYYCDQLSSFRLVDLYAHCLTALTYTPPCLDVRLAVLLQDIAKPRISSDDNGTGWQTASGGLRGAQFVECLNAHAIADGEREERLTSNSGVKDAQMVEGSNTCAIIEDERGERQPIDSGLKGARMAEHILTRLKAPRALIQSVARLVELHDRPFTVDRVGVRRALAACGSPEVFRKMVILRRADAQADVRSASREIPLIDRLESLAEQEMRQGTALYGLGDLAITGNDLQAAGWTSGPALGQCLRQLFEQVISLEVTNETHALMQQASTMLRSSSL